MDHRASGGPLNRAAIIVGALLALSACERDPLDIPCPDVAPGDLVISELHEEWVELHNTTDASVNLGGLVVLLQPLIGSDPDRIIVRNESVTIEAGGYAVLGQFAEAYVDYVYVVDFEHDLDDNAQIRIEACGVEIDAVLYRGLPNTGSYSLDPDADDNDIADLNDPSSQWCVDTTDDVGSPGERNLECM
jgi:hypothetical protein